MPDNTELPEGEKPPLAVNPSAIQGVVIALALAAIAAYGVVTNIFIYVQTRDIAGAIVYFRSSDFLQGLSAISVLAGFGGLWWRVLRRKAIELYLESNVAPSVAYRKGSQDDPAVSPPTRARETITRLVDPIILHRGAVPRAAPSDLADKAPVAAQTEELMAIADRMRTSLEGDGSATAYYAERDALQGAIDRALPPSTPAPTALTVPIPVATPPVSAKVQTFAEIEHEFASSGSRDSFTTFLEEKGWRFDEGVHRWVSPAAPALTNQWVGAPDPARGEK